MPPELAVDLMTELAEENNVLPTSRDWESVTNCLLPPLALVAVQVDVATREISELLLEIPSGQPLGGRCIGAHSGAQCVLSRGGNNCGGGTTVHASPIAVPL